ncbi:hypothetical protein ACIOHC_37310 [Streptomyces sp. NPDC088252]|uniref:hypothetical protein n=1 Tax=Streptomyces sp. NPDC088252 TaxID=3365845 RepID=UPI003828723F
MACGHGLRFGRSAWRFAPPIGPATDLWALGALLYRCVDGRAPYPEEDAEELLTMVCSEAPAFAEECGPLHPVIESFLRRDPLQRLAAEEAERWLRSLVREAPEPELALPTAPSEPTSLSTRRAGKACRAVVVGPP